MPGAVETGLANAMPNGKDSVVLYRLEIKEEARQQLRALPKDLRSRIWVRLEALQTDLAGDVK